MAISTKRYKILERIVTLAAPPHLVVDLQVLQRSAFLTRPPARSFRYSELAPFDRLIWPHPEWRADYSVLGSVQDGDSGGLESQGGAIRAAVAGVQDGAGTRIGVWKRPDSQFLAFPGSLQFGASG